MIYTGQMVVECDKELLTECYANLRNLRDIRMRFLTFFGTATATSLFFSVRESNSSLASLIILFYVVEDIFIRKYERFYFVVSYLLENRNKIDLGITRSYVAFREGKSKRISSYIDNEAGDCELGDLQKILRNIPHYWGMEFLHAHIVGFVTYCLFLILAILLSTHAGWKLLG